MRGLAVRHTNIAFQPRNNLQRPADTKRSGSSQQPPRAKASPASVDGENRRLEFPANKFGFGDKLATPCVRKLRANTGGNRVPYYNKKVRISENAERSPPAIFRKSPKTREFLVRSKSADRREASQRDRPEMPVKSEELMCARPPLFESACRKITTAAHNRAASHCCSNKRHEPRRPVERVTAAPVRNWPRSIPNELGDASQ